MFNGSPARSAALCGYAWHQNTRSASSVTLSQYLCHCPAGTYCPANSTSTFTPIPCDDEARGTFCPKNSISPVLCPAGGYCPDTSSFVQCPAGTVSNSTAQMSNTTCASPCPAGGYCPAGSVSVVRCESGKFQTKLGQTSADVRLVTGSALRSFKICALNCCPCILHCQACSSCQPGRHELDSTSCWKIQVL